MVFSTKFEVSIYHYCIKRDHESSSFQKLTIKYVDNIELLLIIFLMNKENLLRVLITGDFTRYFHS